MGGTFDEMVKSDIKDIFLQEFSQDAIYTNVNTTIKVIKVQLFEQSLDQLDTQYWSAFCDFTEVRNIQKNETLQIGDVLYGVISTTPDEHNLGVMVYLQKV